MSLHLSFAKPAKFFLPLMRIEIPCGKPLAVVDEDVEWIDLNEYLARGAKDSIVYLHVRGDSMIEYGIDHGDLLVVDRARQPQNGKRSVVSVNGEYTVKRWEEKYNEKTKQRSLYLVPGNSKYKRRELTRTDDVRFFGIVKNIIKKGD